MIPLHQSLAKNYGKQQQHIAYDACSVLNKLTLSKSKRSKNLCLITMNQRKFCYYISM